MHNFVENFLYLPNRFSPLLYRESQTYLRKRNLYNPVTHKNNGNHVNSEKAKSQNQSYRVENKQMVGSFTSKGVVNEMIKPIKTIEVDSGIGNLEVRNNSDLVYTKAKYLKYLLP